MQILNERNEIFTIEDDPYMGLSVLACVRGQEEPEGKRFVIQVEEEDDEELFDDVHDYDDYLMMADQPSVESKSRKYSAATHFAH